MTSTAKASNGQLDTHLLLTYIADLELEIDRLRKHGRFVHHQARDALRKIQSLCGAPADAGSPLTEIEQTALKLRSVLHDLQDLPGYHPAHDQVTAIAIRPMIEQVFRWQQRLENAPNVTCRLELESDHVEWFPGRLRHILDNLVSNALRFHDAGKSEAWVELRLRLIPQGYEFTLADNGVGLSSRERNELFGLLYRAAPARSAGLGVGLAVVKLLVEQSGGTLTAESNLGQGSTVVVVLPRYEVDDFLT